MYLIQLLLPLYSNTKKPFPKQLFLEVGAELVERFGGLTVYTRSPASGLWQEDGGDTVHDELVIHEVMAESLDRTWWHDYRAALEMRFRQDTVVIRAQEVTML